MKGEILKLLYIYSLNKRIFDKTAIEILYNIFINNNYDIEKYFKKVGCEYVLIDVFAYNEKAINFYEKHDYHARMYTDIKKL
mgnify:CR=1 FL=1